MIEADGKLALFGGRPTIPEGPPAWPVPDEDVREALQAAYWDGSWGRYDGPHNQRLAQRLAEMHDVAHAWCCSSGTLAVELALRGLRVSPGDEVILAGYDFPGNFRAIEAVGALPVLVDIRRQTWCLDPDQLDAAHSSKARAIIVSHLHGGLAPMPQISAWAARHGVAVVEDACQVPGATVHGKPAGAWGDVGVLSFGGSKLLTAGRGGAVLTHRSDVLQRIKVYCERGNNAYPLSELQAAVVIPQLAKLAERNRIRQANATRLRQLCQGLDGLLPLDWDTSVGSLVFYKLAWLYQQACLAGCPREQFLAAVRAEGVAMDEGFRGFALRSARRCRKVGDLRYSQEAAEATVLLHHPVLLGPPEQIDRVALALRHVLDGANAAAGEDFAAAAPSRAAHGE
jgi:dTDP-4-amino-4,6-dideoxygalactose transaminase